MTQPGFDFHAPVVPLPPLMQADESEQTVSRQRVFDCLVRAGERGLSTPELITQSRTYAAPRRVWELANFYGYVILGEKRGRNAWHWTFVRSEPWARPAVMPWRMAKKQEADRVSANRDRLGLSEQGRQVWEQSR